MLILVATLLGGAAIASAGIVGYATHQPGSSFIVEPVDAEAMAACIVWVEKSSFDVTLAQIADTVRFCLVKQGTKYAEPDR